MQTDFRVAIIGGGSGGLLLGARLSKQTGGVAILERLDRVGKKLLATGNGQGNLTNTDLSLSHYHGDTLLVENAFASFGKKITDGVWEELGVTLSADERGRVYPVSRQASSVLDMLRTAFLSAGGKEITGAEIIRVRPENGYFTLSAKDGRFFTAKTVVIATGGCSGQGLGTDGSFYAAIKALGHTVTPVKPSLVQLKTDTTFLKNLKGIRLRASVTAENATETGDLLFTEGGISGDAAFRLSARLSHPETGTAFLDFLPDFSKEELLELLAKKYRALPKFSSYELLCTLLHKQLIKNVLRFANLPENGRAGEKEFLALAGLLKAFPVALKGTAGFGASQVTKGGVPAGEVNANTLESKLHKNLYFIGEVLNVDGDCGGYNLQWAFSSALLVANEILKGGGV